jgi:hypothetical protein
MMFIMREVHLRNVDLNLLQPLHALLEERHVTRAATQSFLSQPAMSRTLERLREMFGDPSLFVAGAPTSARSAENMCCESWCRSCLGLRPWCEEKISILRKAGNDFASP